MTTASERGAVYLRHRTVGVLVARITLTAAALAALFAAAFYIGIHGI